MSKECRLLGCARPHHARGFCNFHYYRATHGIPLDAPIGFQCRQPLDWVRCGTAAQYRAHLRRGEIPDESCRRAERRRVQDRYARIGRPARDRRARKVHSNA